VADDPAMERDNTTKVEMARRMHTRRSALDRLLDSGNAAVTLQTLARAPMPSDEASC
jgi:hypothetical protein